MAWFTSDLVGQDTVRAVTDSCERDDCKVSARKLGGTLAATSSHYGKDGNPIVDDINDRETEIACLGCWKTWIVHQTGEKVHSVLDVTEERRKK